MSDTVQVILVDGKPIGYFPPTSAENVTYEEGVSVKDALDERISGVTVELSGLTFTANTELNLGTISELSNGKIADATKLRGLAMIYVTGSYAWDIGATLGSYYTSNEIYLKPSTSQPNGRIRFTMLY